MLHPLLLYTVHLLGEVARASLDFLAGSACLMWLVVQVEKSTILFQLVPKSKEAALIVFREYPNEQLSSGMFIVI